MASFFEEAICHNVLFSLVLIPKPARSPRRQRQRPIEEGKRSASFDQLDVPVVGLMGFWFWVRLREGAAVSGFAAAAATRPPELSERRSSTAGAGFPADFPDDLIHGDNHSTHTASTAANMLNITGLKHTGGVSRCSVRVSARTETPASTSSRWRPVGCDLISQISPASATSVGSLPRRYGIVSVHHPGTVVNELSFIRLQRHAEPSLVRTFTSSAGHFSNSTQLAGLLFSMPFNRSKVVRAHLCGSKIHR
ncbi:hypothetical protein HPP92_014866 [Vanilla planifolia]|uniref:Uncharacterized protein n=1 Tax=Vanilla planifolia TaxID=51239 RepID=A0A835UWN8_VANPL|nr:hypothetical protein HPP92_014866 [Vanilla planifolia]